MMDESRCFWEGDVNIKGGETMVEALPPPTKGSFISCIFDPLPPFEKCLFAGLELSWLKTRAAMGWYKDFGGYARLLVMAEVPLGPRDGRNH
jgi:hypothetical protein